MPPAWKPYVFQFQMQPADTSPGEKVGSGYVQSAGDRGFGYFMGGGVLGAECIPVGCVRSAAVAVSWVGKRGVLPEGVCSAGDVCPGGRCLPRGVHPLWTEWLTDRCKNITFPQLLFADGNHRYATVSHARLSLWGENQWSMEDELEHWFGVATCQVRTVWREGSGLKNNNLDSYCQSTKGNIKGIYFKLFDMILLLEQPLQAFHSVLVKDFADGKATKVGNVTVGR